MPFKMKSRIILLIMLTVLSASHSSAFIFTQAIDEKALMSKVKQIDEFFSRFNLETDCSGNPIDSASVVIDSIPSDSTMRFRNLASLLHIENFVNEKHEPDSLAREFINYVARNNKRIHYADTTWCAEATASFLHSGKTYPIRIFLKTENVRDVIYKWVITDIDTPLIPTTDSINRSISIMPGAHGSSFITLPETINLNSYAIESLFKKDYEPNRLAVFAWLVSSGKIKVKNVTNVRYHFTLDDYQFTVERIENDTSYNSGWLINEIHTETKHSRQ